MIFTGCPCGVDGHMVLDPERAKQIQQLIEIAEPLELEHEGKRIIVPPIAVVLHGGLPQ